jgi:hypothetical protein
MDISSSGAWQEEAAPSKKCSKENDINKIAEGGKDDV